MGNEIAIIGAGIAGLAAAQSLQSAGRSVVIFDKGRGPGGRTSLRRHGNFHFDHGAQYFTVSDDRFSRRVQAWEEQRVVRRWNAQVGVWSAGSIGSTRTDKERWVGVPGMNAMARALATHLDVRCGVEVDRVARTDSEEWELYGRSEQTIGVFGTVIVTAPPKQSARLLEATSTSFLSELERVEMLPCWAVLLGFDNRVPTEFDGAFVNNGSLSWVCRNNSKPGRPDGESWVLHANPGWSQENWTVPADVVAQSLQSEFQDWIRKCGGAGLPEVVCQDSHRWAFSQPRDPLDAPYLYDSKRRVGVAGDWCGGPKVEGAFLSGTVLAETILSEG